MALERYSYEIMTGISRRGGPLTQKTPDPISMRMAAFRRVLQLEAERGHENKAVVGGLDRFLDRWRSDLSDDELQELSTSLTATLTQRKYDSLSVKQRERWVHEALTALGDQEAFQDTKAEPVAQQSPKPRVSKPQSLAQSKPTPVKSSPEGFSLDSAPTVIKGVGPGIAVKLKALGIRDIRDLLYHYPSRHLSVSQIANLSQGEETAIVGSVWDVRVLRMGKGGALQSTEAVLGDETGNIRVFWFNQQYVARYVRPGNRLLVNGYFRGYRGQPTFEGNGYEIVPDNEDRLAAGSLVPIYPATKGMPQRTLRRIITNALDAWLPRLFDHLPEEMRERQSLLDVAFALRGYHQPDSSESKASARYRLAFDEMFIRQISMLSRKHEWQAVSALKLTKVKAVMQEFIAALPFTLTKGQSRTLKEVLTDIAGDVPARRLVEGEVGSGKTVVALAAMLNAVAHGHQAAIMAPTEILAQQHFETISRLLEGITRSINEPNHLVIEMESISKPLTVGLMLGSHTKRQKDHMKRRMEEHAVDILVGTHALIQGDIDIPDLALAVVDEEHRFGVAQRQALGGKGRRPHLISMSATPIPRSLALTVYGDMDISIIDELPPGRSASQTRWLRPDQREQANRFIRKEVAAGHQAFVVCPLIDESDSLQTSAAVEEHRKLSEDVFSDLNVGLLHGRMNLKAKTAVMERFRSGEINVLVSTPVVEVGVDIPNATVMMVEGADRFGLSSLHQLRGRVGRSDSQGYCILVAENPSEDAQARLSVMEQESDGFRVAEEDLKLRGPGELTGTRQSGVPDLKLANLQDMELLSAAREEANGVLSQDPGLEAPEHRLIAEALRRLTSRAEEEESDAQAAKGKSRA